MEPHPGRRGAWQRQSLLGLEFIYRGATLYNEPGLIVVFETDPDMLLRDAAAFGWDFAALQQQHRLTIIVTSPQVLDQELRAPDSVLLQTARDMGARRIFIDSIALLRAADGPRACGRLQRPRVLPRVAATAPRRPAART